eukprot:2139603-Rhodomonas_salina.1
MPSTDRVDGVESQPTNLEPQETAMKTPSGGGGTAALAAAASAAAGGGGRGGGGGGDLQVAVETRAASGEQSCAAQHSPRHDLLRKARY